MEKCLTVTCKKDNDGLRWLTESLAPLWPEMQRETQGTVALSVGILLVCCDPTSLSLSLSQTILFSVYDFVHLRRQQSDGLVI